MNKGIFPKDDETRSELEITYKERDYQVELRRISLEGFSESERMLQIHEGCDRTEFLHP